MAAGRQCSLHSLAVVTLVILCGIMRLQAATIYVSTSGNDANDGLSWSTAKLTIQAGIDAAAPGDDVVVEAGTYTGDGNRDLDYGGKAITVRSTDPANASVVAATVIDCQGTSSERHRGFYFHSFETNASVLAGVTITGGFADGGGGIQCQNSSPTITDCHISNCSSMSYGSAGGGGLASSFGNPLILRCVFSGNTSSGYGGGGALASSFGDPLILQCVFSGNTSSSYGGGIYCEGGQPTISDCTFTDNTASGEHSAYSATGGGGVCGYAADLTISGCAFNGNSSNNDGGGLCCSTSYTGTSRTVSISGSTFTSNAAMGGDGGGLYCSNRVTTSVSGCTFSSNRASGNGGATCVAGSFSNCTFSYNNAGVSGGAIYASGLTFTRGTLNNNSASAEGAAIYCSGSAMTLDGSRITSNNTTGRSSLSAAIYLGSGSWGSTIRNCVIKNNKTHYLSEFGAGIYTTQFLSVTGCTITDNGRGYGILGSGRARNCIYWYNGAHEPSAFYIDSESCWTTSSEASTDGHLSPNSPCINAGSSGYVLPGETDIDGEPRIMAGRVDIGADEFTCILVSTAGDDANTGFSWDTAKRSVQAALDAAPAVKQVWVAAGTYVENVTLGPDVALYGGFAGGETGLSDRNWTANATILDGNQAGSVVTVASGATPVTRIDGFTIRNGSAASGGGICCQASSPMIANNVIADNAADRGAGIYAEAAGPLIRNCMILRNTASTSGGGVHCENDPGGPPPIILRCTIAYNRAPVGAGIGAGTLGERTVVSHCLVWDSTTSPVAAGTVTWSLVRGGFPGTGNLNVYPKMTADGHLEADSPCIGAGDPAYIAPAGVTDIDGQPRVVGNRTDIGADEFLLVGDVNFDDAVDVVDLLFLVDSFGTNRSDAGYNAASDFNNDGAVDVVDLLMMVDNWGKTVTPPLYVPIALSWYSGPSPVTTFPGGLATLGGVPFDIPQEGPNGWFSVTLSPEYCVLTMRPYLSGVKAVNALISTGWGQPGPESYGYIEFKGSAGAVHRVDLVGNEHVRDWALGWTTQLRWNEAVPAVLTETPNQFGGTSVVDLQHFILPPEFADQVLVEINLADLGADDFSRLFICGLTAEATADTTVFAPVGLAAVVNSGNPLTNFPSGHATLAGIPFVVPKTGPNVWGAGSSVPGDVVLDLYPGAANATVVHTLINTGYGRPDMGGYIEFFGSAGAYHRVDLRGNVHMRDWNNGYYTNDITWPYTTPGVLTEYPNQFGLESRLDMQHFILPVEFATQVLTGIRLVDQGADSISRIMLSGVTVEAVPQAAGR